MLRHCRHFSYLEKIKRDTRFEKSDRLRLLITFRVSLFEVEKNASSNYLSMFKFKPFFFVIIHRYICNEMTVKPESVTTDQSSLDLELPWTKLLANSTPSTDNHVMIKMNDETTPRISPANTTAELKKSPSWLGSFHNQIRSSIKAVTESPGPITR